MGKYEKKILEDIAEIEQKEQRKEKSLEKCEKQVNKLLEKKDYVKLLELFQTEEVRELAQIENSFATMSIILSIYHMEQSEGITDGILSGIYDMQKAEEKYLREKFLMWRLEFTADAEELQEEIKQNRISVPFLKYLIHTSSFDKANTAYKLAMLLKETGHYVNAFGMLRYVDELAPEEEIVFCEMADICMKMRQYQMAETCIQQIKKPTAILMKYQQQWENLKDECK